MKITLETNRLILRPFELSDAEQMFFNCQANSKNIIFYGADKILNMELS